MRHTSNPVGISRILPGLDFGLLLIVLTCGTAGLEWLTTTSQATISENTPPPTSPEKLTDQIAALQKEIERQHRELDRKQAEADRLQKELDKAEARRPDVESTEAERGQAQLDLEKLRQSIERLKKELQQLQQQQLDLQQEKKRLEQLRKTIAEIKKDLQLSERHLQHLKRENGNVTQEIAELEQLPLDRRTVRIDINPQFKPERNRTPVFVALTEGTVTPVREPYYTTEHAGNTTTKSRAQLGETVNQALAAGSDFSKLLDEIDPHKQYVFFVVDSSSFETFRTVREVLKKRKIPCGWEPGNSTTIRFSSQGVRPGTID